MVSKAFLSLVSAILLSANGCLMTGCASTEKTQAHQAQLVENVGASLEVLERGQFEGDINFQSGGPVAGAGIKTDTSVYLGPGDVIVSIKGKVNFKDPSLRPASDPALTASLPRNQADLLNYYESLPPNAATMREIERLRKEMLLRLGETQADGR